MAKVTTTTATMTATTSFFPSLRDLIDGRSDPRISNDDWWLLDEILFETSQGATGGGGEEREEEKEEEPPMPTEFPTLTSLGIGAGSNRIRSTMGSLAAEIEKETVSEGLKYFCILDSLIEQEIGDTASEREEEIVSERAETEEAEVEPRRGSENDLPEEMQDSGIVIDVSAADVSMDYAAEDAASPVDEGLGEKLKQTELRAKIIKTEAAMYGVPSDCSLKEIPVESAEESKNPKRTDVKSKEKGKLGGNSKGKDKREGSNKWRSEERKGKEKEKKTKPERESSLREAQEVPKVRVKNKDGNERRRGEREQSAEGNGNQSGAKSKAIKDDLFDAEDRRKSGQPSQKVRAKPDGGKRKDEIQSSPDPVQGNLSAEDLSQVDLHDGCSSSASLAEKEEEEVKSLLIIEEDPSKDADYQRERGCGLCFCGWLDE